MIKLNRLIGGCLLCACFSLGMISCSDDDYPAIELIYADNHSQVVGNTLTIAPFSNTQSLYIIGGDGSYLIQNSNEEVALVIYNGETVQFKPLKNGETNITISDRSGNSYTLLLQVRFESITYTVTAVDAEVEGDRLQVGEQRTLKNLILNDMLVQKGGSYTLEYTNESYTQGNITLCPSSSLQQQGFFYLTQKQESQDFRYYSLNISLSTGENLIYSLVEKEEDGHTQIYLTQDVTADYKNDYPLLEKAVTIQYLEKTSTNLIAE